MAGLVHPPKAWKSEKEGLPSQWAYQSCWEAAPGQALKLPMMVCHMYLVAQMAGTLPWLLILLIVSIRKLQLPVQSLPHPHPELGLVSTSIQTIPQRLPEMAAIIWSTCAEADLPLQGNIQMSVMSPAARALLRLLTTLESTPPQEQQPRMIAKEQPLFFMHWQVEVEKSWLTSTPSVQREGTISNSASRRFFITNKQQSTYHIINPLKRAGTSSPLYCMIYHITALSFHQRIDHFPRYQAQSLLNQYLYLSEKAQNRW